MKELQAYIQIPSAWKNTAFSKIKNKPYEDFWS